MSKSKTKQVKEKKQAKRNRDDSAPFQLRDFLRLNISRLDRMNEGQKQLLNWIVNS